MLHIIILMLLCFSLVLQGLHIFVLTKAISSNLSQAVLSKSLLLGFDLLCMDPMISFLWQCDNKPNAAHHLSWCFCVCFLFCKALVSLDLQKPLVAKNSVLSKSLRLGFDLLCIDPTISCLWQFDNKPNAAQQGWSSIMDKVLSYI